MGDGAAGCSDVACGVNALATSGGAAAGGATCGVNAAATSGGAAAGGTEVGVNALATSGGAAAGGGDDLVDLPHPGGGGFRNGGPVAASGIVLADAKEALDGTDAFAKARSRSRTWSCKTKLASWYLWARSSLSVTAAVKRSILAIKSVRSGPLFAPALVPT